MDFSKLCRKILDVKEHWDGIRILQLHQLIIFTIRFNEGEAHRLKGVIKDEPSDRKSITQIAEQLKFRVVFKARQRNPARLDLP